jgi:hypothetical protein
MDAQREITASGLGYYLDGWADLIEGMGAKVEKVRADILRQLKERNMPDVYVEEVQMKEGLITLDSHRDYVINTTFPGVTTTIYVAKHGNDLFASWRTFICPTINWLFMAIYYGIAFLSVISINKYINEQLFSGMNLFSSNSDGLTKNSIVLILSYFTTIIISALIYPFVYNKIVEYFIKRRNIGVINMKQEIFNFIRKHPNIFWESDIQKNYKLLNIYISFILGTLMFFIAAWSDIIRNQDLNDFIRGILDVPARFLNLLLYSIPMFFFILFVVAIAGIFLRRNILAFILKEPSLFDQEDITAMSLTVHKTLLHALDMTGIDVSKLRIKGEFKGGRRGENI